MVIGGIFLSLGFIYVYSIGPFVSFFWLSFACTILPLIFFLSMIFMPESPYYDVKKGNIKAAEKSLIRLRGKNRNEINEELKNIQVSYMQTLSIDGVENFWDFYRWHYKILRKSLELGVT